MNDLPGMWYEINHMTFFIDLTWCDMYTRNYQVCEKKSTTWCLSRRNRTPESEKKQTSVFIMKVVGMISCMICTDNDARNCQVCDTKSTTWCFSRGNRTPESEKKQTSVSLMNESSWHDRSRMICTENDARNCQVRDTKSTTWCSWSISHDVIGDTTY